MLVYFVIKKFVVGEVGCKPNLKLQNALADALILKAEKERQDKLYQEEHNALLAIESLV